MPPATNNLTPTAQPPAIPSPQRTWPGRLLLLALIVLLGYGVIQHQAINDWFELYGYTPPAAVSSLAAETTMTPVATHLFYINHPDIEDKADFAQNCPVQEQTIVLGCYHSGEDGIYILQISDKSSLNGVMQVTAAHEMLHAAYQRLPASQKATIDRELQDYYDHDLTDPSIKADINAYKKTEPGQLLNEMHSIFGTEVAKLPVPLEQYYSRYFSNRQAIVRQADKYETAFRSRQTAVKTYDAQLAKLKPTIDADQASVQSQAAALADSRAQMDDERSNGQTAAYNAAVPAFNRQVGSYNSLLTSLQSEVTHYNDIVHKRNALVLEEQELVKELSGSVPSTQQ